MQTINLLPFREQRILAYEKMRRTILFFSAAVASIFLVGAILLLPSFFPLWVERRELLRGEALETEAARNLKITEKETEVRSLQAAVASLRKTFSAPSHSSALLEMFLRSAGSGVSLQTISVKTDQTVALSGNAAAREDLLLFEKALRDSGVFQDLAIPLSSIVQEQNITFSLIGKLKK